MDQLILNLLHQGWRVVLIIIILSGGRGVPEKSKCLKYFTRPNILLGLICTRPIANPRFVKKLPLLNIIFY